MKRYKLKEYFNRLGTYKGREIADIDHSVSQFRTRFPDLKIEDYYNVIHNGIDTILDVFNDSTGKYIIVSKSLDVAVQVHWRPDRKMSDRNNHAFTSTTLDAKIHTKDMQKDTRIFVEEFIKNGINKYKMFESLKDKEIIKEIGYYGIDIPECTGYKQYIKEGVIYTNFEIIEVE